jgi:membrane protein required for colicin V production
MIDLVLLAIIGVSALLGLIKGFVGIVVSTAAWVLAAWASFQFGEDTAHWLAEGAAPTGSELLGGYALTFIGVLVTVGVVGMVLKTLVRSTHLTGIDRMLGFGLGLLRGGAIACVLVLLMSFTPLRREPAWQQSQILPILTPGAEWMHGHLPDWSPSPSLELPNDALTGDNGVRETPASSVPMLEQPLLKQVMSQALDPSRNPLATGPRREARTGDPVNIEPVGQDPAAIRPDETDPANIESRGQARPGSKQP